MRKIIVSEFITIDGVFGDPGGSEHTPHGGWSLDFFNDEYGKFKNDELFACDAQLLGRTTYDGFAEAWPNVHDGAPFTERMNTMKKYVVTSRPVDNNWENTTVMSGDIVGQIRELKTQPGGNILVAGSGQLVRVLLAENLVDELRLMVHPVVVGAGKRLFTDESNFQTFTHTDTQNFTSGITVLTYQPNPLKGA